MSKRSIRRQIYIPVFAVALLCAAANASAQGSPSPSTVTSKTVNSEVTVPDYDVVSVKESKSAEYTMLSTYMPDGFRATNISLEVLIAYAYGIRQDLISGAPGWVDSTRFDLEAKVAGADVDAFKKLSPEQLQAMLQSLLVDRFKLKIHLATKVLPIYELVKEKGGFKIKEAQPSSPNFRGSGPGMFKGGAVTLQDLANGLSSSMQRTVLDKTGIAGKYDIDLKWNPGEGEAADVSADAGPTLFTALQEQLGLKLQPTKGPVETLVIDAVENLQKISKYRYEEEDRSRYEQTHWEDGSLPCAASRTAHDSYKQIVWTGDLKPKWNAFSARRHRSYSTRIRYRLD